MSAVRTAADLDPDIVGRPGAGVGARAGLRQQVSRRLIIILA
jgi:hypothetical protein